MRASITAVVPGQEFFDDYIVMSTVPLSTKKSVSVVAPARLHMGFLDPDASLGRKFGSIGVALNEIATRMVLVRDSSVGSSGPQSERAEKIAHGMLAALDLPADLSVQVIEAIPEHVGLGSGTQMALALGAGISELYGLKLSIRDIARIADRGARSGIGIGCFEQGGLIVDGGRDAATVTPPVICRMPIPADWRFILVFDERGQGLAGFGEIEAFRKLGEFAESRAARICHLLMLRGLPAVAERNLEAFGAVISEIQQQVGDYFAPAQGGRYMSDRVEAAIEWLGKNGAHALGQSSWGPTGFCLIEGLGEAQSLVNRVRTHFGDQSQLRFELVSARNRGGETLVQAQNDEQAHLYVESGAR